ncbi:MAG: MotA/TolQ/ExbB proton channel family protein [Bacteroidales bacterium]|nr:MotA/TolQ/ExbB proton channel family protein [Bacteroidales bacterium]
MIIRHFFEGGGFFMFFIYLMWITVITLAVRFIILYSSGKNPQKLKRTNDSILFIGSFAFLFAVFGQMLGLVTAFDLIQKAGEAGVVPSLVAGGLKVTFIPTFYGLLLLIVSAMIWFVFRNLKYSSQ